jgi:hypothetical protein
MLTQPIHYNEGGSPSLRAIGDGNDMLTTIEGTYHGGKITLLETTEDLPDGRILVTFLNDGGQKSPHRQMVFGQFAGTVHPTEEDFKIAEWHGEDEFDDLNGE